MRRVPRCRPPGPVYIVLDDFGPIRCAFRETDPVTADIESIIRDFLSGSTVIL